MSPALGNGFGNARWTGVSKGTGHYVILLRVSSDRAVCLCHELMSIFKLFDAELCTCSRS